MNEIEDQESPLIEGVYFTKEECGEGWDKCFSNLKEMKEWLRVTNRTPTSVQVGHNQFGLNGVFIKYD